MDDRLKQVQTTDLTDSRLNHEFVAWLKTSGMNYLLMLLLVACVAVGVRYLRVAPKLAYPLLAYVVCLLPVLQLVPIGAVTMDKNNGFIRSLRRYIPAN